MNDLGFHSPEKAKPEHIQALQAILDAHKTKIFGRLPEETLQRIRDYIDDYNNHQDRLMQQFLQENPGSTPEDWLNKGPHSIVPADPVPPVVGPIGSLSSPNEPSALSGSNEPELYFKAAAKQLGIPLPPEIDPSYPPSFFRNAARTVGLPDPLGFSNPSSWYAEDLPPPWWRT